MEFLPFICIIKTLYIVDLFSSDSLCPTVVFKELKHSPSVPQAIPTRPSHSPAIHIAGKFQQIVKNI